VSGATTTPRTPFGSMAALAASSPPGEQPADIEGRAVVRKFLENYLTYTPTTLEKNWADALNMMTHNLRTLTLDQLRDQDIVSKVHDDEITSTFRLRSLEPVKGNPGRTSRLESKRSIASMPKPNTQTGWWHGTTYAYYKRNDPKEVPSGLLVAEYGEQQMRGRKGQRVGAIQRAHGRRKEVTNSAKSSDGKEQELGITSAMQEVAADRRDAESRPAPESKPARERSISIGKPAEEPGNRRGGKRRRASKDNEGVGHDSIFLD